MNPRGSTPKERKFLALRCPSCSAQVNVGTEFKRAKCPGCGLEWVWRSKAMRVTLADTGAVERRLGRRFNPTALEVE